MAIFVELFCRELSYEALVMHTSHISEYFIMVASCHIAVFAVTENNMFYIQTEKLNLSYWIHVLFFVVQVMVGHSEIRTFTSWYLLKNNI